MISRQITARVRDGKHSQFRSQHLRRDAEGCRPGGGVGAAGTRRDRQHFVLEGHPFGWREQARVAAAAAAAAIVRIDGIGSLEIVEMLQTGHLEVVEAVETGHFGVAEAVETG